MRSTVSQYTSIDLERSAQVFLYRGTKPYEIRTGVGTPLLELTEYVSQVNITNNSATIKLTFQSKFFDCQYQPRMFDIVAVKVDGTWRSVTHVDQIADFTESRGSRSMTVKSRSVDGFDIFRMATVTSPVFSKGSNYTRMMEVVWDVMMQMPAEDRDLTFLYYYVPHSNVQFSEETPWDILQKIAWATNREVFITVEGVLKTYAVDTMRDSDIMLDNDQVVEFGTGKQYTKPGTSSIRLTWLDPLLKKQYQNDQILDTQTVTAGFFKLCVKVDAWFSPDHTQRAEDTYMKVKQTANGLFGLHVVDEDYSQVDPYHGEIRLTTPFWVPTLYVVGLATLIKTSAIPDIAPPMGGPTEPVGRIAHGFALIAVLGTMMAIGTGTYEVYGSPYDYVHAKNYTIARATNYPELSIDNTEIESNLIVSETHAQDVCIRHLQYLFATNYEVKATIVDDPRIEIGDILQFEDGSRMFVTGFANDFTRGADASMDISGYLI